MNNLKVNLVTLLSVCWLTVFTQNTLKNEFVGVIKTSDEDIISYKINFTELENGKIEGFSYTDFYGKNYTKSKIVGTLKESKLSFKEIGNVSSKSKEDIETFCFIHVENLKIKTINEKRIIQGKFKGLYSSGKSCTNGTIYLAGAELLEELNLNTDSLKKIDSLFRFKKAENDIKLIKANDRVNMHWVSDRIILHVWDSYTEDNDIVNIYFNDILIEENLVIKNNKKVIEIPFTETNGIIKIVAINEGYTGTNTVNFILKDKIKSTSVMSSLKTGEEVFIEFNH